MPDTTATPPPAAPAAAAPSTPAPETPKPISQNERHPALKNLLASLQTQTPPGEPTKPRTKPDETPKPADAPAATKPDDAPAAPVDKPIKVKKAKAPERPPLPTNTPATPAAPVAPAPAAPVAAKPTDDLSEEEQGMLEDSRDMEKMLGQKHTGLAQKTEKFLRDNKARRAQLEKEGVDPDTDQEYMNWLKANKPQVSSRDYEQLRQERATIKAKEIVQKENDDIRHELHVRDEEPKVRREIDAIYGELARTALPDEVQSELTRLTKEHGPEKAWKMVEQSHRMEIDVAGRVLDAATKDMELFLKLTRETPSKRPLLAFDQNNPDHMRIHQMIGDTCAAFKEHAPRERQVRDGKWFVTRDEWNQLPAEQRANFWTFTNAELLKVAQGGIKPVIAKSIEAKRKEVEAMGFTRAPRAAAPAAPATPPVPTPRTSLNPSPIPTAPASTPSVDPKASSIHARLNQGRSQQ